MVHSELGDCLFLLVVRLKLTVDFGVDDFLHSNVAFGVGFVAVGIVAVLDSASLQGLC
jgi:hypothetical protein